MANMNDPKNQRGKSVAKTASKAKATATSVTGPIRTNPLLKLTLLIVVVAAAVFALFYFVVLPSSLLTVPFTTFKDNYVSAPRVAILANTYFNGNDSAASLQCFARVAQVTAFTRNRTTMDLFVLNRTNCTFSPAGAASLNLTIRPISYCLEKAQSEPSIFLNYSSSNYTVVRAYGLHVYGNAAYMQSCPLAVDIS
ncbi:Uncharacterised protein [uncultured archaeon]|nr:Uncharacterised protein [uncultured archaeon]